MENGADNAIFSLLQKDIESNLENEYKLTFGANTLQRDFSTRFTREVFHALVETKSCMMTAASTFAYKKIDNDQFTTLGVKCFFLPQTQSLRINIFAGFKYFHAALAAGIMQHIDEAGIVKRWIVLDGYAKMLMMYTTQKAEFEEVDEFHKLDLASHLQILFYLWMIVLLLSTFCFVGGFAYAVGAREFFVSIFDYVF